MDVISARARDSIAISPCNHLYAARLYSLHLNSHPYVAPTRLCEMP